MYECHVTIEYVAPSVTFSVQKRSRYEILADVSLLYKFRVAKLYKWNKEQSDLDTFMTGHDTDYDSMKDRMTKLVRALYDNGFKVTRYKIEQILLDSKNGDSI